MNSIVTRISSNKVYMYNIDGSNSVLQWNTLKLILTGYKMPSVVIFLFLSLFKTGAGEIGNEALQVLLMLLGHLDY